MKGRSSKSVKTAFVCSACGTESQQWQGKCFECGGWGTLVEEKKNHSKQSSIKPKGSKESVDFAPLKEFAQTKLSGANVQRFPTGFEELDRVLGGGLFPSSLSLIGGSPGVGKSTLLLQILAFLSQKQTVLYVSGEESGAQLAERAQRLELDLSKRFYFCSTHNIEEALKAARESKAEIVVVDSVQTLKSEEFESVMGSVSQVRAVAHEFLEFSKSYKKTVLLVGHITKEGAIAGPKLLEHMVDSVYSFELSMDGNYRLLRGQKNRFGPTHEVAVFEMKSSGLMEVNNPSSLFLQDRSSGLPGSSIVAQMEGTRSFLYEFQALIQRSYQGFPRRTSQGVDQNRIAVLLAVLERCLGLNFSEKDLFCKVSSGAKIQDSTADFAICSALFSSYKNKALPPQAIFLGEVGLGGALRSSAGIPLRLKEAFQVGLEEAYVPASVYKESKQIKGLKIHPVKNIQEITSVLE